MKLYSTTDIEASIRKACAEFTHVVLNRAYTLIRPAFFNTGKIADLNLYQFASWIPATAGQLDRWGANGGLLIEQDTTPYALYAETDVTVMVECPYSLKRIELCHQRNKAYGVIPNPMSWKTHEDAIDMTFPTVETLQALWRICGHQKMTNADLAAASGIPVTIVQYLKGSLKPQEHWYMKKKLAPERDEFVEAWDWIQSGAILRREVPYRAQIEEMARFGYIDLKKVFHYPNEEPDWRKLEKKRDDKLSDLAAIRSLVEALPDHLAGQEPSDVSL